MSTLTIEIKLINRIKIQNLPKEYVKKPKLPMRLRGSELDHLNVFSKTIQLNEDWQAREAWSWEITGLKQILPFYLSSKPNFGDKLIGCISDVEFGDFYAEIYQQYKWITK
jgi:hypothetical protein